MKDQDDNIAQRRNLIRANMGRTPVDGSNQRSEAKANQNGERQLNLEMYKSRRVLISELAVKTTHSNRAAMLFVSGMPIFPLVYWRHPNEAKHSRSDYMA